MNSTEELRRLYTLDEETIDILATKVSNKLEDRLVEKVAKTVEERFYSNIGKTLLSNIFKLLGIISVGSLLYLNGKGFIKF